MDQIEHYKLFPWKSLVSTINISKKDMKVDYFMTKTYLKVFRGLPKIILLFPDLSTTVLF